MTMPLKPLHDFHLYDNILKSMIHKQKRGYIHVFIHHLEYN